MFSLQTLLLVSIGYALTNSHVYATSSNATLRCRNIPGSPGFPSAEQWDALNRSVSGQLVLPIPSAKFCKSLPLGTCSEAQWTSSVFRDTIPGAMDWPNYEQDYDSNPPSLCLWNGTTCEQGDVPLYGILAQSVSDVQAGINFARTHDLRLAVKASGHDFLGRSTAKSSLMISTRLLQNVTFTDDFKVGKTSLGSAITVGSGADLTSLYPLAKAQGKTFVGPPAARISLAGGYFQGAGHSVLSPTLGLAVDNVLEIEVVTADGVFRKANSEENTDLFWAMRGGGAGSWGVVTAATFRTYPTFNATSSLYNIATNSSSMMGSIAALHAKHIFDLGRNGQYFTVSGDEETINMSLLTGFLNTSIADSDAIIQPFLAGCVALGANVTVVEIVNADINDILTTADDGVGADVYLGSRLMPESVYRENPEGIGAMYTSILEGQGDTKSIRGILIAGGQVAENANISSAVNPKWRTAKTHIIIPNGWVDTTPVPEIQTIRRNFQENQLPYLLKLAGIDSGAYSNEADPMEANPGLTFFGVNYPRLSVIKRQVDPTDLFIVAAGVGSERWDAKGLCQVDP